MKTKDILELRRRFTKDNCTFTRLCGCYVNADKVKVTTFNKTFLNLEDEEFYKYLDIAKSIFKGKIGEKLGDNLLVCSFKDEQYGVGTRGEQLIQLRGNMKNEEALDAFYDIVIDNYDYVGNYLILLFHDVYDVMKKASDNEELEESEEVYEYLLCAICPVGLTTPGLEYREDENRIAPRIRDWVVGAPETGFLYPAFTDRSEDQEHVLFYTKDALFVSHRMFKNVYGMKEVRRLGRTAYENIAKSVAAKAGITDKVCTVHVYRKTFATRLAENGCPLEIVQELLGHSSADITSKHYVAKTKKRVRKEFERCMAA